MPRKSFGPTPNDRDVEMTLNTDAFADVTSVNLDTGELQVVEVDDTPEEDRGRPTEVYGESAVDQPDDNQPKKKSDYQKRIDRLKFETETERRAREASERREQEAINYARTLQAQVDELRQRTETSNSALANSMKAEREARMADAKRRLASAHADGNAEEIANATADLTTAAAELTAIAARTPRQPQQQAQPQQQRQPAPQQAPQIAPNVAAWIARNDSWFNKDKAKTDFAVDMARSIEARGISPNSDEYIREIDKRMKAVYPDHQPYSGSSAGSDDVGERSPRRTNVVAEGSRATAQPAGRTVELTASELAVAKQLGLKPEVYAASKMKSRYNGRTSA